MNHLVDFLENIYNQGWQLWSGENQQIHYEAPANKSIDSVLATLKEHKTEILHLLSAKSEKQPLVVPLTEAQKQLWFLDQLEESSKQAYVESVCLNLEGELHIDIMKQAIQEVVKRHEALRTKICPDGNFQEILPVVKTHLPLIDLSNFHESEVEFQKEQYFKQEIQKPFNLNQAPLLRVYIFKLKEKVHQLFLIVHHIISDGFSMEIILKEISCLYSAQCQENISELEPPMQFREYIDLQNKIINIDKIKCHESYWLEKFSSVPTLNLPTDFPRPPIMNYKGGSQTIKLDAKFCNQIKRISSQKGCTLFMILLSTYKILLYKLTSDKDIVVGIAAGGRSFDKSQSLVGYCAHLLPIKSSLFSSSHKCQTFSDVLLQIREILLDDYEHQDYPFSRLLNKLNLKSDPSRPVLVSTLFNFSQPQTSKLSGLKTSLVSIPKNFIAYDLVLDITEIEGELLLNLYYNLDTFSDNTVKRWLGYFQNLLSAIVENPQLPLDELPLLSQAERHQLLVEWNDTAIEYPCDKCIHQLFEERVQLTPDAIALVFADQQLSYSELNARANKVAHYLRANGVKPEMFIGICLHRSIELVVGILGILKAGGAYVPLDPNYPQQRLNYILEDSQLSFLLTQENLLNCLPQHQVQTVLLDSEWDSIKQHSSINPINQTTSSNVAYIIYTSGSTGKPKGIMIEHRNTSTLLYWAMQTFSKEALEGVLATTSICFDLSVFELFVPLSCSGKIILTDNILDLPSLPFSNGITLINTVPSAVSELLKLQAIPKSVHTVNLAGEPLGSKLVEKLYDLGTVKCVYDLYGPSEDTTYSTFALRNVLSPATIGRPIANTQIYLLDSQLQPVPIGACGELYIAGAGVTRGYLNRPELTAEKFIPNSFSNQPGARLYKTGDLARYLSDGNIQFLGRIDYQVKIRGFRIELGEIEAVLHSHPQVEQSAVIAREDLRGDKYLVAYIVSNNRENRELELTDCDLRSFLKHKLPDYMIPTGFVFLDTLPLTPNGKLDRSNLPAPNLQLNDFVPPRTAVEESIADIFGEVLGLSQVGIYDNFFEIGGHSLNATQIISRLQERFRIDLRLRRLLEEPTVAGMAVEIEKINSTIQKLQSISNYQQKKRREIEI